ncbi:MAG: cytochrome c maturation protein CcmE [Candidatus Binatus sp.]|jgi:cytochrome c-type biogenesis protein CcmE|uniref:cytochrome c maturation protein CcmE n=1 Tax=Candidatus Binatus sp. TaxID=2811406 RepID=UPI003C74AD97
MRIRPRFFIGGGLIVLAIGYLIFSSIRTTSEYYLTVPEVAARQGELGGQAIRVAGRVKPGNIAWDPDSLTLKFEIGPIPDIDAAGAPVKPVLASDPVSFRVVAAGEPKPDMFAPGRDVIVEGRLGPDGEIAATQVMTSCPSKYKPKQSQ